MKFTDVIKIKKNSRVLNKCKHCRIAQRCLPAQINKQILKQTSLLQFDSCVLEPGQFLYRQGEHLGCLYALRSGVLKSFTTLEDGSEFIMAFLLPPNLFGWEAIDKNQLSVSVAAVDYSNVCKIDLSKLSELIREFPEIELEILRLVSLRIQNDNQAMLRSSAEQRVANFILQLSRHYSSLGFPYHLCKLLMTHQDIANYLRIAPETISRTFKQLQSKGIISVKRKDIYLNDIKKLAEIARIGMQ